MNRPMYFPYPAKSVVVEFFTDEEYPAREVKRWVSPNEREYVEYEVMLPEGTVRMRGMTPDYALVIVG